MFRKNGPKSKLFFISGGNTTEHKLYSVYSEERSCQTTCFNWYEVGSGKTYRRLIHCRWQYKQRHTLDKRAWFIVIKKTVTSVHQSKEIGQNLEFAQFVCVFNEFHVRSQAISF